MTFAPPSFVAKNPQAAIWGNHDEVAIFSCESPVNTSKYLLIRYKRTSSDR